MLKNPKQLKVVHVVITGLIMSGLVAFSLSYLHGLTDYALASENGIAFFDKIEKVLSEGPDFLYILISVYFLLFYMLWKDKCYKLDGIYVISVLSLLLSLSVVCLSAVESDYSLGSLFRGVSGTCLSIASFLVLGLAFWSLLVPLFNMVPSLSQMRGKGLSSFKAKAVLAGIFFLAWLPYLIVFSPGSPSIDLSFQLGQYLEGEYSTHHPLFSTLIYGCIYSIGSTVGGGSANIGLLLIVLIQAIVLACAFVFEIDVLDRFLVPLSLKRIAICFFAFCPIFGIYSQWAVKDSLFMSAFVVFASMYALYVKDPLPFSKSKKAMLLFVVSACVVGLLRNNAFYVVLLSLPFLVFLHSGFRERVRACIPLILAILLIPLVNQVCVTATSATKGSVAEALSLPFQQTARYALYHSDDVRDWERDAIDQALGYESIAERYNPLTSDPVKAEYRLDGSLSRYFKAWISQGIRHPLTYLSATVEQTYGFWCISASPHYRGGLFLADYEFAERYGIEWNPWIPGEIRSSVDSIIHAICAFPLINLLFQPGFYTWLLLFEATLLIFRKKRRYLVLLLPCFFMILTCIAGPVNGDIRYMLGVVAVSPLMLFAALMLASKEYSENERAYSSKAKKFDQGENGLKFRLK